MRAKLVVSGAVLLLSTVGSGRAQTTPPAPETLTSGSYTLRLPLGLQASAAYVPETNPLSREKVDLGKLLYFERRLSKDNSMSCATCHLPYHGFAEPGATSEGVTGAVGKRNAPTVINRLFSKEQFWDGRAADLEEQAHGPLTNPIEMAMLSHDEVLARLKGIPGYAPLFEKAFGTPEITMARVAQAIASYERTVVSGNSPFDRFTAGDKDALSTSAVRGLALFNGKANCQVCHAGFNFTDESYHNLGVGMGASDPDLGRYVVTKAEGEKGAFKTPTLRNVAETPPYMHDGSEPTLRAVVDFYNRGGRPNPNLAKEIKPLGLTPQEITDLVAFMEALTADVPDLVPPKEFPK
jgi:cytochrome c peroxidase